LPLAEQKYPKELNDSYDAEEKAVEKLAHVKNVANFE